MHPYPRHAMAAAGLALCGGLLSVLVQQVLAYRPLQAPPPQALPARRATAQLPPPEIPPASAWMRYVTTIRGRTPPLAHTDNVLLVGLDRRAGNSGGRTDALVVLVLERGQSPHAGLVSIPRDLLVAHHPAPGSEALTGGVRINTVYKRAGEGKAGLAALGRAIEGALGLPIKHTVLVDLAGFEVAVDAIGGVTVLVRCPIIERFIHRASPEGHRLLTLEAGPQHLDGAKALMFARARHGRGIFDRARRQQALLEGLKLRALSLGPARLEQLLPSLRQALYSEISAIQALRLANRLRQVAPSRTHGLVLDSRHAEPSELGVGAARRWVLIPKPEAIRAALATLFSTGPPGKRRWRRCPPARAGFEHRRRVSDHQAR